MIVINNHALASLLADCNEYEKRVLFTLAESTKASLRENRHYIHNRR